MSIEAPAQYSVGLRLFRSEFRIRSHADKDVSDRVCIWVARLTPARRSSAPGTTAEGSRIVSAR